MSDLLTTIWINAKTFGDFVKEAKKQGHKINEKFLRSLWIEKEALRIEKEALLKERTRNLGKQS